MGSAFAPTVASATTSRPVNHGVAVKNEAPFQTEPGVHTGATGHVGSPTGDISKGTHANTFAKPQMPQHIVHPRRV